MRVFRSVVIDAPIGEVWAAVRAFDGVANWNPGVVIARMESGTPTGVTQILSITTVTTLSRARCPVATTSQPIALFP